MRVQVEVVEEIPKEFRPGQGKAPEYMISEDYNFILSGSRDCFTVANPPTISY